MFCCSTYIYICQFWLMLWLQPNMREVKLLLIKITGCSVNFVVVLSYLFQRYLIYVVNDLQKE